MQKYLGDGLVYEAQLPLLCEAAPEQEMTLRLQGASDRNQRLLQCLIALDERGKESLDEDDERSAELMRLEAKVDMLLELVSGLVQQNESMGESVNLKLGAEGVGWEASESPFSVGQQVWIYLHLDRRLPQALKLPAIISEISQQEDGRWLYASFLDQGERFSDLLQKVIFRHHRRQVALLRAGQKHEEE
ncbi:MAG: PilZ domain-containing protein [Sedimenticola sp.]